ncbi:unnamed protein product, partial [Mesorhabditis belari]|uniref:Uncharacterized protein n=1 Tax=Mesorhabditis belari TaxID=2138241 RepID=A0AAF3EDR5_9BILA
MIGWEEGFRDPKLTARRMSRVRIGIGAFIRFCHPVQLSRDISYYINKAREDHNSTHAEIWAATVVLQRLLVWNGVWEENGKEKKRVKSTGPGR